VSIVAICKKKSRLISVDRLEYRWLISFNDDAPFYRVVTIAIELSNSPGTKLIVYPIDVDVNFVDYNRDEPFTPKSVEQFIRKAHEAGWSPMDSSGTFTLGDRRDNPTFGRPALKKRLKASIASIKCSMSDGAADTECEHLYGLRRQECGIARCGSAAWPCPFC
jgi:hypothetical protein